MARKPQFGSIRQRGAVWWIRYYRDGQRFDESSHSEKYTDAVRLLEKRRAEIHLGTHIDHARAGRRLIGELLDDLLLDYRANQKGYVWAETIVRKHLKPVFGSMRAGSLAKSSVSTIQGYVIARQATSATNATINREIAVLHRAMVLAKECGKISLVPSFPKPLRENNVRKGFFEHEEFIALRAALPEHLRTVVTFAYWTGCRKGEILALRWPQVDLIERVVRLEPGETKNDEPRIIPFIGEMYEMLAMQRSVRDTQYPQCSWVFFRDGQRIGAFRKSWDSACKAARLWDAEAKEPTKVFHDFRRTGVRNLVRAGVPERVAMMISGHKTRSVFDRYNVVSESDLHDAAKRVDRYIVEKAARTKPARRGQKGDNPPDRRM
jgi:integrase